MHRTGSMLKHCIEYAADKYDC